MKVFLFLILFLFCFKAHAQTVYPPDIAEIKQRDKLIVAMTAFDTPPFYGGTINNMSGLDVDIAKKVAKILGVPVVFNRDATSFAGVIDQVVSGKADMAISKLSITGPRMNVVKFSTPYVRLHQAMIVNRLWLSQNTKNGDQETTIKTFNGSISFIANSSYDTFARTSFPRAIYRPETSWDNIVNGVISGKYSAGFRDEFEIKRLTMEKPTASIHTKTVVFTDSVDNIAAAVPPNNTHLLTIIDHVIKNDYNNIEVKNLLSMLKKYYDNNKE